MTYRPIVRAIGAPVHSGQRTREQQAFRDNFIFVLQHIGIGMRPASEMRLTFLQLDQVVVVLVLETDKATDFDAFAGTAQPILDSIAWP